MYSFYGGRPGNSFIIIMTYPSVSDMIENFQEGPAYTEVHYDEYVMINTEDKNNPENGQIYRRGYDFNNEMGGAEYIGTIVGPAGKAPMLEMTTVSDVNDKHNDPNNQPYNNRYSSGEYKLNNNSLIPGKYESQGQINYNDKITWACYSIRNENNEDTIAYIGFIFPYMVIDFETSNVEPYNQNEIYADTSSITRIDDGEHPFYQQWHINIPKGVKGDAIKNLEVITIDQNTNIESYTVQQADIGKKILVYDYYNYDQYQNGNPKKIYLGDYNMIDDITMDQYGTVTIQYTHDSDKVLDHSLKWINDVTMDQHGVITIDYNDSNSTTLNHSLKWINSVTLDNQGNFTVTYNQLENGEPVKYETNLKWVSDFNFNSETGEISIKYNDNTIDSKGMVKYIDSIDLEESGNVKVTYNDNTTENVGNLTSIKSISTTEDKSGLVFEWSDPERNDTTITDIFKFIDDIELTNNGTLIITLSDGTQKTFNAFKTIDTIEMSSYGDILIKYNNSDIKTSLGRIKSITNIGIDTGITEGQGSQKIKVQYNDELNPITIGNPINYIMEAEVDNNNHLLVRYSDPYKRQQGGITWRGKNGWTDIGQINMGSSSLNLKDNSFIVNSNGAQNVLGTIITPFFDEDYTTESAFVQAQIQVPTYTGSCSITGSIDIMAWEELDGDEWGLTTSLSSIDLKEITTISNDADKEGNYSLYQPQTNTRIDFQWRYDSDNSLFIISDLRLLDYYGTQIFNIHFSLQLQQPVTKVGGTLIFGSRSNYLNKDTNGLYSTSLGTNLIASGNNQLVIGSYNKGDKEKSFIIGNGEDENNRHNIVEISNDGEAYFDKEIITRISNINLGTYHAAGTLTNNGGDLHFSIPTGRVFPKGTTIASIQFKISARAGNSTGTGLYIIKNAATGTDITQFNSNQDFTFYNGESTLQTIKQNNIQKILYGQTNIGIKMIGGERFFTGPTANPNTNNQPVAIWLTNISVTFNIPS